MKTIYRENTDRLSVADAKRLILDAVPVEKAVDVYVQVDDQGNINWDGDIECRVNEKANIPAVHLDNDFLATCNALSIQPRMKYRPVFTDYTGNVLQDEIYTIAHDEFLRLAELFGLLVVTGKAPEPMTTKPSPAPVVADKRKEKKPSIESVAFDYMRKEYQSGQFQSASKFHKHLIKTAGLNTSPFEMGTGTNARKLFCPAASSFFEEGTLSKIWSKIRAV